MTAQSYWLVDALERGAKVEARRDRAELAAERRFMAERRREAHGAGRGITSALALTSITAGLVINALTPLPTVAAWVGVGLVWVGAAVLVRILRTGGAS